jgi:hypothetical protein
MVHAHAARLERESTGQIEAPYSSSLFASDIDLAAHVGPR